MTQIIIPYEPQPRQEIYHQTTEIDELLYGGAAGGGKSEATIWDSLQYALEYPESRQIIFRRTFPDLQRSIIARTLVAFPKEIGKYNQSKHEWTFINGSVIELAYFDSDAHKPNYAGAEYDVIRWEELTHFEEGWYKFMLSRLRGSKPYPRFVKSTTNPGSVGHAWVKRRFIDIGEWEQVHHIHECDDNGAPLYHPDTGEPIISRRVFVPAKVQDNPALLAADPNYIVRLMQLSENERKQLLDGDWDTFAGMYFDEFSRAIHVVEPFAIPQEWKRFRMMDEGYNDPFVCLWGACDREGNIFIYRELIQSKLLSSEQAERVNKMTPSGERMDYSVGDTSFWNKGKADGKAPFEVFLEKGIPMMQATKERVNGWKRVREWLHVYEDTDRVTGEKFKTARLKIFNTCRGLIEAIPSMVIDDTHPEDVAEHPLDHACFVSGTLIETNHGQVPIEQIKIGDMVMTRDGYKPVIDCGITNENAVVSTAYMSNGSIITATGNHPVYVENKGFVRLDTLRYGDIIKVSTNWGDEECESKKLNTMGTCTGVTPTHLIVQTEDISNEQKAEHKSNTCTMRFTRIITEKYRKAIMSTTRTEIQRTTIRTTLKLFRRLSIFHNMARIKRLTWSTLDGLESSLSSGTNPKRGENGILNMVKGLGKLANRLKRIAKNAAKNLIRLRGEIAISSAPTLANLNGVEKVDWTMRQEHASFAVVHSQLTNMKKSEHAPSHAKYVLGVKVNTERQTVYNLTVAEAHEYYANGLLVHNCDALRYGLMSRPAPTAALPDLYDASREALAARNLAKFDKPKRKTRGELLG